MSEQWITFTCKLPPGTFSLLEEELERIRNLADIDPDDRFSQEIRDGLCMEYLIANSRDINDEEVL